MAKEVSTTERTYLKDLEVITSVCGASHPSRKGAEGSQLGLSRGTKLACSEAHEIAVVT